jgi:2,4-dienoyl-CoA reductase-like NADH-dependent reductase (Old Yellow Enzyme family)
MLAASWKVRQRVAEKTMQDDVALEEIAPRVDIEALFEPLKVKSVTFPNRFVMAPMTRNFSPGGIPGADVAAYYRRRAEGGVGAIMTEATCVEHRGAVGDAGLGEHGTPYMYGDAQLAGWRRVVEDVHAAGAIIFSQLWHMGVMKKPGTGPYPDYPASRPAGLWGPTDKVTVLARDYVEMMGKPTAPMSESEIGDVIAAFARSAANAKAVGFDGIALHGGHGYLIDTFLWGETNTRKDLWGGDHVGRTRFAVEIVKAIRRNIGEDMPISLRFSQWKSQDYDARIAQTPAELEQILTPLVEAGVDIFDASTRNFQPGEFEGSNLNLAGWAKKLTGKPSIMVGGAGVQRGKYDSALKPPTTVNNLDKVMERFDRGEFDLLAVGRSLLNDPNWIQRARWGEAFLPFDPRSMQVLT